MRVKLFTQSHSQEYCVFDGEGQRKASPLAGVYVDWGTFQGRYWVHRAEIGGRSVNFSKPYLTDCRDTFVIHA